MNLKNLKIDKEKDKPLIRTSDIIKNIGQTRKAVNDNDFIEGNKLTRQDMLTLGQFSLNGLFDNLFGPMEFPYD